MNFYKILLLLSLYLFVSTNISAATALDYSMPIAIDSRIKTFVYSPNEVFTVILSHGYHSYIEFDEGEIVQTIAMGDSVNWKVRSIGNRLFIMPVESSGKTNIIVITSKKRTYVFDLICRVDSAKQVAQTDQLSHDFSMERDLSYIVRFYYPKTEDEFDSEESIQLEMATPTEVYYSVGEPNKIIEVNDTKHNYSYIAGENSDDIVPDELFDDGYLTYFKFKDGNKVIPKIFIKDNKGVEVSCKMLLFENYITIKGVHQKLSMRYQNKYVEVINKTV